MTQEPNKRFIVSYCQGQPSLIKEIEEGKQRPSKLTQYSHSREEAIEAVQKSFSNSIHVFKIEEG